MTLFKKILFPTDFSDTSLKALSSALKLAQMNNSELIILYSYRLNGKSEDFHSKISYKSDVEKRATDLFTKVDKELLSLSGVNYTLLSEVGFIGDRIVANISAQDIDLVILSYEIQQQLQKTDEMKHGLTSTDVFCPVLLLPKIAA